MTVSVRATMVTNLTTGQLLFFDDFEAASQWSTNAPLDNTVDADPVAQVGSWTITESTLAHVQVTTYSPAGAYPPGSKWCRAYRASNQSGHLTANFAAPQSSGQTIRLETMVYISNDSEYRCMVRLQNGSTTLAGMAPAKDGTNRVIRTLDGGSWTPTTVPWEVGVWQKWTLEYTANATTFQFSVDGIEGTASATAGLANNVYFYNGDWVGSGWFGLDYAPAQTPAAVSG